MKQYNNTAKPKHLYVTPFVTVIDLHSTALMSASDPDVKYTDEKASTQHDALSRRRREFDEEEDVDF